LFFLSFFLSICLFVCLFMCVIHLHARHALERTPGRITNRHFERSEKKCFAPTEDPQHGSTANGSVEGR
jgi:hypothetical protein